MPSDRSPRTFAVLGGAILVVLVCTGLAFSVYSDPELSTDFAAPGAWTRLLALASPIVAGMVPAVTAIILRRNEAIGWPWLVGAGLLIGSLLLAVPLSVGLIQQAGAQTMTAAIMLVSFLAFGMGMAAAVASLLVLWIDSTTRTRQRRARRLRVIYAIEHQLAGSDLRAAQGVEIGDTAYAELIADWGVGAEAVVVRQRDAEVIALSSPRWPAPHDEPIVELPILHQGPPDGVQVVFTAAAAPADR